MKKIAAILLALIILLLLSGYYITGIFTEKTLKHDIALLNQSQGIKANLKSYDRGFFTSKATFDWIIDIPERILKDTAGHTNLIPAKTYTVNMPLKIYHGPVIFAPQGVKFGFGYAKTSLTLPAEYLEQFNSLFTNESVKPIIDITLLVNYLNKSHIKSTISDFKLISKEDGSQFEWQGMKNNVLISYGLETMQGDLVINGIVVNNKNRSLKFDSITSEYDLKEKPPGLYVGTANVGVKTIAAHVDNTQTLLLDNLQLNTDSNINNKLLNVDAKLSFTSLFLQNKNIGPGNIEVYLSNLDSDALYQLNNKISEQQQNNPNQQLLWTILPELPKLFNQGANLELKDGHLKLPEGRLKFYLKVGLAKGDLDNPLQLMQKLNGDGKITISKEVAKAMIFASLKQELVKDAVALQTKQNQESLVQSIQNGNAPLLTQPTVQIDNAKIEQQAKEKVGEQLASMEKSGLLNPENDDYIIKLDYRNGKLFINDNVFTTTMLDF